MTAHDGEAEHRALFKALRDLPGIVQLVLIRRKAKIPARCREQIASHRAALRQIHGIGPGQCVRRGLLRGLAKPLQRMRERKDGAAGLIQIAPAVFLVQPPAILLAVHLGRFCVRAALLHDEARLAADGRAVRPADDQLHLIDACLARTIAERGVVQDHPAVHDHLAVAKHPHRTGGALLSAHFGVQLLAEPQRVLAQLKLRIHGRLRHACRRLAPLGDIRHADIALNIHALAVLTGDAHPLLPDLKDRHGLGCTHSRQALRQRALLLPHIQICAVRIDRSADHLGIQHQILRLHIARLSLIDDAAPLQRRLHHLDPRAVGHLRDDHGFGISLFAHIQGAALRHDAGIAALLNHQHLARFLRGALGGLVLQKTGFHIALFPVVFDPGPIPFGFQHLDHAAVRHLADDRGFRIRLASDVQRALLRLHPRRLGKPCACKQPQQQADACQRIPHSLHRHVSFILYNGFIIHHPRRICE